MGYDQAYVALATASITLRALLRATASCTNADRVNQRLGQFHRQCRLSPLPARTVHGLPTHTNRGIAGASPCRLLLAAARRGTASSAPPRPPRRRPPALPHPVAQVRRIAAGHQ